MLGSIVCFAQQVSPRQYGLDTASSGVERYRCLLRTHQAAVAAGTDVDYSGIDSLFLELPPDAVSIPLTKHNDFAGCKFTVLNKVKDIALFALTQNTPQIAVDKETVATGDFSGHEALRSGHALLILYDMHPWVGQRIGYGYAFYRRDVLLLRDGKALNQPVAPYNTDSTKLTAYYCTVDTSQKLIENIGIERHRQCTFKTYCINIIGQYNVLLRNIAIATPKSRLTADGALIVQNSVRVAFEDITIRGTYSAPQKYGYGFSLNNVADVSFARVVADGKWGVFGTNNMSNVRLRECDLNRFDIHCYGRDVECTRCTFRGKQTQFSSFYGRLVFDSCLFADCIPVRIRASYNAYTPFDIVMRHCRFDATRKHHALVNVMLLDTSLNRRPELADKCWPNLTVEDLEVAVLSGPRRLDLYDPTGKLSECDKPVGHLSHVCVDGLTMTRRSKPAAGTLQITTHPAAVKQEVTVETQRLEGIASTPPHTFWLQSPESER